MNNHSLHSILIVVGAVLIASNLPNASSAAVPGGNDALRSVSTTINQFAVDFYKATSEEQTDNLICSPVSLSIALSMAAFGAGGETAKEMRSGLHLPANDAVTKSGFESLIDTLNKVKEVKLQVASKIFTASGFEIKPAFKEVTTNSFKSAVESLNFENTEASSATINAWCSAQTNGLIKEIVEPEDLDDAAMILVNAVYFKGQWNKKFQDTQTKQFHISEETSKRVPMMYISDSFNYGTLQELDAHFVEIPYKHENEKDATSMFIILPNTVGGLKKAESNLHNVNFQQLHDRPRMTEMHLFLPKFKAENFLDLGSTLKKMGMRSMFSEAADFTGITGSPPLKISKVFQKAVIEVNEEGSEAAAITEIGYAPYSITYIRETIKINRPFIYAIVHGSTNTILFQGHITLPKY